MTLHHVKNKMYDFVMLRTKCMVVAYVADYVFAMCTFLTPDESKFSSR